MKLFTKEIDKKLFQQYPYGSDLAMQKVVAKIFNPYGRGTWYILNSDPEDPDYLWAIVDLFDVEMGSVSRTELESIKVKPFGLGLERDLHFTPVNALELFKGLSSGKMYAAGGISDVEVIEKNNEAYLGLSGDDKKRIFVKFEDGGNLDMLKNQSLQFKHHAEELHNVLKNNPKVHAWVVAKAERASTDLSDITHYLEGTAKLADGGQLSVFEKGGDLSNIKPYRYNFDTYIKIEGTNYGGKLVLGSETKSDGSTHKYLSHIEWDENNVPESAEQVERYVAENLNQLLMDAYKYADGGQIDTEFSNSLWRINDYKYRIKKIIEIREADLRDRSHFMGTRVPYEWKNYSVFIVKYIPDVFNGDAYPESILLLFSNDKQREELIEMLKSFKGGETISISKYADGGSVLSEDTVARVDDPLFADLSQYARGGNLSRDRKFISQQEWEKNYKRKTAGKIYKHEAGGELGSQKKYYAILNILGEHNNGIPVTIISDSKKEIIDRINEWIRKNVPIENNFSYNIEDLNEESRMYLGKPLDGYISDDYTMVTDRKDVFDMNVNRIKSYLGVEPQMLGKYANGGSISDNMKMYEVEFSWKKQSDDDFDSRKVVVMASDINDAVKKVTDKFSSYYEGFEIVEAEKEEEEYADGGSTNMNIDWDKLFQPLSEEEDRILKESLQREGSELLTKQKDQYKVKIGATGKDWNDAFIRRVNSSKNNIAKFVEWANTKKGDEKAITYFNYALEDIETVRELGFGATKYANNLERLLRQQYDKMYVNGVKKYADGGSIEDLPSTLIGLDDLVYIKSGTHQNPDGKIVTRYDVYWNGYHYDGFWVGSYTELKNNVENRILSGAVRKLLIGRPKKDPPLPNEGKYAKGGKSEMYISGDDLRDKLEAMSDDELLQYYVDENGFDIDDNDHRERIEEERDSVIDELVDEYVRMMKSSGRFYKDGGSIKTRAKSVKLTTTDGRVFFDGKNITDADEAIYFVWKRDKYSDVLYDIVFEDGHKLSGSIDLEPKSFHAPHKKNILSFHLNTYWNNVAKTKLPYIPKEFVESASNLVENYDLKYAKGGGVNNVSPFEIGEIVWDSQNQSYGVVLENYKGDFYGEVRLDSDGNQPVKNLHKLGSKGDKGSKYKLIGALLAHKRLVDEYGYDTVKYAKGGKVPDKKVADIRLRVQKFLRPLGYEATVTEEHDFVLIEPSTRKVGDKRKDYFDGMQIIRDSDGTYEVSEYQAGENQNELHIYKKTKSLLLALKDLIKGNKRKPIKIYK